MPTEPPRRTPLLGVELPVEQVVERVQVTRVELAPGQAVGRHSHPCAVVGHVVSGRIRFQVEDADEVGLGEGDAFYEPAGTPIAHFDNASTDEAAVSSPSICCHPGRTGRSRCSEVGEPRPCVGDFLSPGWPGA